MVSRIDYTADAVSSAYSVLLEIMHILGEYRKEIVLVGGWVPDLLFSEANPRHIGSIDIDLALDHRIITREGYRTIREHLEKSGYEQGDQLFKFRRRIEVDDREISIEIDFMAGEYGGTGRGHRHQRIQDIGARKARGCDLALDIYQEVEIAGTLPDGGKDSIKIRVASMVPFLIMKGMALYERQKEKDAYDIYFCLKNYPGGLPRLAEEFRPHLKKELIKEGLEKIGSKFESVDHIGPKWVADFFEIEDLDERELVKRDAFERVNELLKMLAIGLTPG